MGIFKDDTDYSGIKPQPYPDFNEQDRMREAARERAATETEPPLTETQRQAVREQAGIHPVTQTVADIVRDAEHGG